MVRFLQYDRSCRCETRLVHTLYSVALIAASHRGRLEYEI